jgi:hypothetical protein
MVIGNGEISVIGEAASVASSPIEVTMSRRGLGRKKGDYVGSLGSSPAGFVSFPPVAPGRITLRLAPEE